MAKGISRVEALLLIPALRRAAERVNADPVMLHRIRRVAMFGSYLSSKRRLGDLDIAVDIEPIPGRDRAAFMARYPVPPTADPLDRLHWPEVVAKCSLRVSPHVHTLFWQMMEGKSLPHRVIWEAEHG